MTDQAIAQALRKPFQPGEVGKLPRVTCSDCSDKRKTCDQHSRAKCDTCGSYISTQHIHLDYVGHADVTSRLLEADPEWNWEPKTLDVDPAVMAAAVATGNPEILRLVMENAPPKFDLDERGGPVGLWIRLTVGGTTRPGYGSCPSGQGDAVKVLIGDALRNAAMRFGVALDLWAKGERADPAAENATAAGGQAVRNRPQARRESFDDASPAGPAQRPNGSAVRPERQDRPAVSPTELDPDAQVFADEAALVTTTADLVPIHVKAREAHKLASLISNPATGGKGGLGQYLNWRRNLLAKAEKSYEALKAAAAAAGVTDAEVDVLVKGHGAESVETATAEQMDQAAASIATLQAAGAG